MKKTTVREIKSSFGRYFAIMAIVALGVGFFAGLRVTTPAMIQAGDVYTKENALYDFRVLNTLGFEDEDVDAFLQDADIEAAEGSVNEDFVYETDNGEAYVLKAHSLTKDVNRVVLREGRLPETDDECVLDNRARSLTGLTDLQIGDKIVLADSNGEETKDAFTYSAYTVVGFVDSPYYLNYERGTSKLGNGKVSGFVYMPIGGFTAEYYSEIFLTLKEKEELFTDAYDRMIEAKEDDVTRLCETQAQRRYDSIMDEAQGKLEDAQKELDDKKAEAERELSDAKDTLLQAQEDVDDAKAKLDQKEQELKVQENNLAAIPEELRPAEAETAILSGKAQIKSARAELEDSQKEIDDGWEEYETSQKEFDTETAKAQQKIDDAQEEIDDIEEPDSFVLTRDSNVGYACFENDSEIVRSISTVFPLFFFLVAALVCMTTMNRMVEEQRTQIGILKALGYSGSRIMGKYIFYAGSAAIVGGVLGFCAGSYLFPKVIWAVYGIMYGFAEIEYLFDVPLFILSMAAALLCSVGSTYLTCRMELMSTPSDLIRPKAPKSGKRILLERVTFIWNRLKFLQKVSVRNLFRYKKRFFMMIIGISGCTALLVTGYGIKDSIGGTAEKQYDEIQTYDALVSFTQGLSEQQMAALQEETEEVTEEFLCVREETVNLQTEKGDKECTMVVPESTENLGDFLDLHTPSGESIAYPGEGEAVLTRKLAERYGWEVGDTLTFRDEDMNTFTCRVSGICENFVYNYVYINRETYEQTIGKAPEFGHAFFRFSKDWDIHEAAAVVTDAKNVSGIMVNQDSQDRFDNMIQSLNYIVLLVIICAGALAFIVLYNLTNINITERIREIATIKVLGFYPNETASYVFKENFALTAIGGALGLVLGVYLHRFVMYNIDIDAIDFNTQIATSSFLLSYGITFLFTAFVDVVMYFKLERIDMVESLKSIE
jgi:putative ABC transport system permease protein